MHLLDMHLYFNLFFNGSSRYLIMILKVATKTNDFCYFLQKHKFDTIYFMVEFLFLFKV